MSGKKMAKTQQVDTLPEEVGVDDALKTSEIDQAGLAAMFAGPADDIPEEAPEVSDPQDEKPADESVAESEPEEESSEEPEEEEAVAEEEQPEEEEAEDEEPPWFRKRFNKLTAQRKQAEERVAELESKLAAQEKESSPASTVEEVTTFKELDALEKQALDAEDQIDELLDAEPKYDDDGNAYWEIGDNQLSKKQLIQIRKNARTAFRAIPTRREFLKQQESVEKTVESIPFFNDEDHPYYAVAQETLNSAIYKELAAKIPDAKAAVALMVRGKMAIDAESKNKNSKQVKSDPKPKIPAKTTSKAVSDTGTVRAPVKPEASYRKQLKETVRTGNVGVKDLAQFF
jgi:hypothetical protein